MINTTNPMVILKNPIEEPQKDQKESLKNLLEKIDGDTENNYNVVIMYKNPLKNGWIFFMSNFQKPLDFSCEICYNIFVSKRNTRVESEVRQMKNLRTIVKNFVCNGQTYKISTFTAETDAEKKFGDNPWIAVHDSYTEKDLPLNGLQMLISHDRDELMTRVKVNSAVRTFKEQNPSATDTELLMFVAKLEV